LAPGFSVQAKVGGIHCFGPKMKEDVCPDHHFGGTVGESNRKR
jgi:hypothetical protein